MRKIFHTIQCNCFAQRSAALFLAVTILTIVLSGCASGKETSDISQEASFVSTEGSDDVSMPSSVMISAQNSSQPGTGLLFSKPYPNSDTLAKDIFNPAINLYLDFDGMSDVKFDGYDSSYYDSSNPDYFKEVINGIERWFRPVNDERYPTYQSFVEEICKHFSEEIVQELLSKGYYIERNGKFYAADGARGGNILYYDVTYTVMSQTPGKVVFTATARYIKDDHEKTPEWIDSAMTSSLPDEALESKDILYTYEMINDRWVFTSFELFY